MKNLDLLFACFNQYVFSLAKENISSLEYYYQTNVQTAGNSLMGSLINAIKDYDLDTIGLPLFQSILAKDGKNQVEQNQILNTIIQYKQYSKEQMIPIKKYLNDIVASVIIGRANKLNPNSPSDMLKYLKNVNFKSDEIDYLKVIPFQGIDINTLVAEDYDDCIPSKFQFINESFSGGGYNRGQMIIVCCPPGTGKTLFAMEEILGMALKGYKCLYYAAGDINQKDFLIRMGAQYTGSPFIDVAHHMAEVYKGLSNDLKDNLDICITPANTVSAREFVDYIKNNTKNYDVIVADYDSNFKMGGSDNMYSDYGEMYATFSELTVDPKYNKLLFVLAQPKVTVWNEPIINLSDVGESSRKQHTADVIITRGREPNCPNHLAPMKIVKNRRGEVNVTAYSIRLNNGRTKILPKELYSSLKEVREKCNYSEPEIDKMINDYIQANNSVMKKVGLGNNVTKPNFKTPFGN